MFQGLVLFKLCMPDKTELELELKPSHFLLQILCQCRKILGRSHHFFHRRQLFLTGSTGILNIFYALTGNFTHPFHRP